ncbi:hypothetical protein [Campylobacter hyointestinalis]|uniref:hypothetical protein n=1 Tax=Campylobacter hyointestinalis TaxID=198 RepID=UPI000CE4F43D|nr:hypothetical protein [Campylobacter hyointestinalis]PPB54628.1 hypothetical protein CDQ67_07510 [Campylobacter hyointestinalis subsp. hyointestinalis]
MSSILLRELAALFMIKTLIIVDRDDTQKSKYLKQLNTIEDDLQLLLSKEKYKPYIKDIVIKGKSLIHKLLASKVTKKIHLVYFIYSFLFNQLEPRNRYFLPLDKDLKEFWGKWSKRVIKECNRYTDIEEDRETMAFTEKQVFSILREVINEPKQKTARNI